MQRRYHRELPKTVAKGVPNKWVNSPVRNVKTRFLSIALIALPFFGLSCDLLYEDSAPYSVLQASKFRVTKIEAAQPARLDRLDVLFLWRLNEALDTQEIEEIHHFVEDGGTLIVTGDHESLDSFVVRLRIGNAPRINTVENFASNPDRPHLSKPSGGRNLLQYEHCHPVNGTGYGTALRTGNRLFGCDIS